MSRSLSPALSEDLDALSHPISDLHHNATPSGSVTTIATLDTYVAKPSSGDTSKCILVLSDALGFSDPNLRVLGDDFASNGYYVVIPDLLEGDPIPEEVLPAQSPDRFVIEKIKHGIATAIYVPFWRRRHNEERTMAILRAYIEALRTEHGVRKIGAIGFSWGGRYTLKLEYIEAGIVCHPTGIEAADFDGVICPIHYILTQNELVFSKELQEHAKNEAQKRNIEIQITELDAEHGFALRFEPSDVKSRHAKEQAFEITLGWFRRFL
ncbi:Protein AIM2 [Neolecta irregularis DAH-3]|uniref:Protein AIM2 n=1 Tax=Neolecta irregularis (strain DAH-3) TaxID=1198029 RepID=A0A1U7LTM5_NEOID|nr:Protein AIM2 [Neolecta irregularis DAH-3]|eukprot:OLL26017.1 Protein AIM2 [Neolecta irregularis DAH-3]